MSTKSILTNYIQEQFVRGRRTVQAHEDLLSSGVLNSLGILKLVSFIEERFDIRVPDEDIVFENFQNIDSLSTYLENQSAGGSLTHG